MKRFLGLDYGDKTLGVAVSDPSSRVALGLTTLRRTQPEDLTDSLNRLGEIINEYAVGEIVLGYPKKMDGSESARCAVTNRFKQKLTNRFGSLPVHLWDERLSTIAVERIARYTNAKAPPIDEMSAVYILQGYLDHLSANHPTPRPARYTIVRSGLRARPHDVGSGFHARPHIKEHLMTPKTQNTTITMRGEDGEDTDFHILATREYGGKTYLVAEIAEIDEVDGDETEVLFLASSIIEGMPDEEDAVFKWVDETHEAFEVVCELFHEDLVSLGIELEEH